MLVHRVFMSASLEPSELVFGVMQHLAVSFLERKSGSGLLVFSAAAGTGVVFLSPRRSEGDSAPGSGADYPLGGGGAWI